MNKKHGILALALIALDQITKLIVANTMEYGQSIPVLGKFFELTYVHNTGAAWSMLEGKMMFFYLISIAALLVLGYFYFKTSNAEKLTKLGLVMMMAGTIGNFIDRLAYQYVIDFLDFVIFGYDFPVFNVADSVLCIGVLLILFDVFLESRGLKKMKHSEWRVTAEDMNERIDKVAAKYEAELTRSRLQTLIDEGSLLVNGKPVKNNYKVKLDDFIELDFIDDAELDAPAENLNLDIVYEDSDVIVINKPRGMVVHPSAGNQHGTLVNGLLYHCTDLSGINGVLRPGIVHRIDKDTTGLLIAAKNDKAHLSLADQLKDKTVNRLYYALVHGVMEHDYGTIDAPIGRDVKDRQKMAVTAVNSKHAVTHFKVVERFKNYTLVECRLETGRTHQIRVHMQYIKHPVVGDQKYSYRKTMDCGGQLLHAHTLTFVHPSTGESVTVHAPLPQNFQNILDAIRKEEM